MVKPLSIYESTIDEDLKTLPHINSIESAHEPLSECPESLFNFFIQVELSLESQLGPA